jgi:hypothetical protein
MMGHLRHGSARTTAAVRRVIQHSQERIGRLAERYHVTPKTVAKGNKRTHVHEAPLGPKHRCSTVLRQEEDALIVGFRKPPLLPLDNGWSALQATMPHGTRAARHRGLTRPGITRVPDLAGDKPANKPFKPYPIGSFPIDMAEVRTEAGKLRLFVAIARTCTFADAERHNEANTMLAAQCLRHLIAAVPDQIHPVLPDNGLPFTTRQRHPYAVHHIFDVVCHEHGIAHRLTPYRCRGNVPAPHTYGGSSARKVATAQSS